MTFEDYKDQYSLHIEGHAHNDREAHDSAEEEVEPRKSVKHSLSKKDTQMNRTDNSQFGRGDADVSIEKSMKKSTTEGDQFASLSNLNKTVGDFKFDLSPACFVHLMKKALIEKMAAKYFLSSHPYPKIEGEMIIFKP